MRFFFLEEAPPPAGELWRPPPGLARHLQALRFEEGEEILLLPPVGDARRAALTDDRQLRLGDPCARPELPLAELTLATAWPKGSRADELVVRAAESGVTRILPLLCARSVGGRQEFSATRRERWLRLLRETCQQCRRPHLPELHPEPMELAAARAAVPDAHPVALVPGTWPLSAELDLHPTRHLLLFVGPEGGFDAAEEQWFREQEIAYAGLLPTILRIEAAGPAAAAIFQHHAMRLRGH